MSAKRSEVAENRETAYQSSVKVAKTTCSDVVMSCANVDSQQSTRLYAKSDVRVQSRLVIGKGKASVEASRSERECCASRSVSTSTSKWFAKGNLFFLSLICIFTMASAQQMHQFQTRTYPNLGVALVPNGLVFTSVDTKYLPVIIHVRPPPLTSQEDLRTLKEPLTSYLHPSTVSKKSNNVTEKPRPSTASPLVNGTFCLTEYRVHDIVTATKTKLMTAYNGVLDTSYFSNLLAELCAGSQNMCQNVTQTRGRRKRQLGLLISGVLGLTGMGFGIANNIHLEKLDKKIAALHYGVDFIRKNSMQNTESIKKLTVANEHLYAFVHHEMGKLYDTMLRMTCDTNMRIGVLHEMLVSHVLEAELRKIISGLITAGLHTEISPDVIDIQRINDLIHNDHDLSDTVLAHEPNLLYQIGRAYPVHADIQNLDFAFMLEIPVIPKSSVYPFYQVYNVGWNNRAQKITTQIKLPAYTVLKRHDGRNFVEIDQMSCRKRSGLWYCPADALINSHYNDCFLALKGARNVSEACEVRISRMREDTEVHTTVSGVLLRTNKPHVTISNNKYIRHQAEGKVVDTPESGVIWVSHSNYAVIVVGDKFITSTLKPIQNVKVVESFLEPVPTHPLFVPPIEYSDFDAAKQYNEDVKRTVQKQILANMLYAGPVDLE